jgi:hypothetical protein
MRLLPIVAGTLVLAVSASLTPANAGSKLCPTSSDTVTITAYAHMWGSSPSGALEYYCLCRCNADAMRGINTETPTFRDKKYQACSAKCVNAFEASRR